MSDKEAPNAQTTEKHNTSAEQDHGDKQEKKDKKKKDKKKDTPDKSSKPKPSKAYRDIDEPSETSEAEIVSQPVTVTGKNYQMEKDEIIYATSAQILNRSKAIGGDIYITHKALVFCSKQIRPSFYVELLWPDIKEIKRSHKRGYDKSITISLTDSHVIFASIKDRDSFMIFSRMIKKSYKTIKSNAPQTNMRSPNRLPSTYGFIAKNDDAEVVWKINVLKAPHVFEDMVTVKFQTIFEKFRSGDMLNEMVTACGGHEYVTSSWRSGDGLSRNVSFTQPMLNPPSVAGKQMLRKSGNAAVFESQYVFSRASSPNFLSMNMQIYCKQEGDNTQLRGAFILDWDKETWDKEFVEAAVIRMGRMHYYYVKSAISNESFNVSAYEGKWRLHQPYVLTIISLVATILCIIVLPKNTNWYSILAAFCVVALFFYF